MAELTYSFLEPEGTRIKKNPFAQRDYSGMTGGQGPSSDTLRHLLEQMTSGNMGGPMQPSAEPGMGGPPPMPGGQGFPAGGGGSPAAPGGLGSMMARRFGPAPPQPTMPTLPSATGNPMLMDLMKQLRLRQG